MPFPIITIIFLPLTTQLFVANLGFYADLESRLSRASAGSFFTMLLVALHWPVCAGMRGSYPWTRPCRGLWIRKRARYRLVLTSRTAGRRTWGYPRGGTRSNYRLHAPSSSPPHHRPCPRRRSAAVPSCWAGNFRKCGKRSPWRRWASRSLWTCASLHLTRIGRAWSCARSTCWCPPRGRTAPDHSLQRSLLLAVVMLLLPLFWCLCFLSTAIWLALFVVNSLFFAANS